MQKIAPLESGARTDLLVIAFHSLTKCHSPVYIDWQRLYAVISEKMEMNDSMYTVIGDGGSVVDGNVPVRR